MEREGIRTHGPTEAAGNRGRTEEGGVTEKGVSSVGSLGWIDYQCSNAGDLPQ